MKMTCHNCGHIWDYKGKSKFYATCPNCHYKVNVQKMGDKGETE